MVLFEISTETRNKFQYCIDEQDQVVDCADEDEYYPFFWGFPDVAASSTPTYQEWVIIRHNFDETWSLLFHTEMIPP